MGARAVPIYVRLAARVNIGVRSLVGRLESMLVRVASGSHPRVNSNTILRNRFRLAGFIAVALLLHLPATPAMALLGFASWAMTQPKLPPVPTEEANAIPISLTEEAPQPPPKRVTPPPVPEPKKDKPKPEPPKKLAPKPKPPVAKPPPKRQTKPGIADPVALSGKAGKVADENARVRLLVFNDRLRKHAMAKRVSAILSNIHQWKDFFGPSGLNPVEDLDRILIAGPQLRDSSQLVVVVQHHLPEARMKEAVDALVSGPPKGKWVEDAPFPTALAHADRAERLVAMPDDRITIVAPVGVREQVMGMKPGLLFPKTEGKEIVAGYIKSPWRSARRVFPMPKSIKWLRLAIYEGRDGGAVVKLVAEDESEAAAKRHATQLTRQVNKATEIDLVLWKERLVKKTKFVAKGKQLEASIVVTRAQLRTIMDLAYEFVRPLGDAPATPATKAGDKTPRLKPVTPTRKIAPRTNKAQG